MFTKNIKNFVYYSSIRIFDPECHNLGKIVAPRAHFSLLTTVGENIIGVPKLQNNEKRATTIAVAIVRRGITVMGSNLELKP